MEPREMVPGLGTAITSERGAAAAVDLPPAPVPFDDVRGFVEVVEAAGELRRLDGADWDLEIGALTELVNEQRGPALLFDHIKGYPAGYRVLSNVWGSLRRTALTLGFPQDADGVALVNGWRQRLKRMTPLPPRMVARGPVLENRVQGADVDLERFPAPRWHELDGGRYIATGCAVITRDPDTGWINAGTYRGMIHDRNLVGVKVNKGKHGRIHLDKALARGEPCPVAIVLGFDPSMWAATASQVVPDGVSEYEFSGWLRGRPIDVLPGPLTGLPIPATAEIVLEGELLPGQSFPDLTEGPFGEWMGYYADTTTGVVPVMRVDEVSFRNDPILLGAPPLKPPGTEQFAIHLTASAVWDEVERAGIPDVRGVWILASGWGPLVLVVAIRQRYAGHARQAGLVATGCRSGAYGGRLTIVVDDDVDITNAEEVLWAVATRCRVERDIDIVRGVWQTPADPTLTDEERNAEENTAARAIIDACRPYRQLHDFAKVCSFPPAYRRQILDKWGDALR
jgi:4-hydroxy-3-polyprenylbenzoate decarboxylase